MSITKRIIAFSNRLYKKTFYIKRRTIEEQTDYLNHKKQPKDDIQRSYYQHCCKIYKDDFWLINILKNIISLFLIPAYLLKIPGHCQRREKKPIIFMFQGDREDFIPECFQNKYLKFTMADKLLLKKEDKKFLAAVYKRYPFSFYFFIRILLKVASYSYAIESWQPDKILCSCEYSGTSSIMTKYCEEKNIEHINIMHGELEPNITYAFCRFSKFYIWDNYYKNLLLRFKADNNHFILYAPGLLILDKGKYTKKTDYKYYLQLETNKSMKNIKKITDILIRQNYRVMLRPHPLYTGEKLLRRYFKEEYLENPRVPIEQSICESIHVISKHSTVLLQAGRNGITAIIDDISHPSEFEEIKRAGYIMLEEPHELLSQELSKIQEKGWRKKK